MQLTTTKAKIRLTAEILMEIAAVLYILAALREARFLGPNIFIENLVRLGRLINHVINRDFRCGRNR
jgi:hypothetical protein